MIEQDVFAVEPWSVRERELHLDLLAQIAREAKRPALWTAIGVPGEFV
ncbi:MAG: hypothetical protein ACLGHY_07980 [Gammaproteobacteria bacterium]